LNNVLFVNNRSCKWNKIRWKIR